MGAAFGTTPQGAVHTTEGAAEASDPAQNRHLWRCRLSRGKIHITTQGFLLKERRDNPPFFRLQHSLFPKRTEICKDPYSKYINWSSAPGRVLPKSILMEKLRHFTSAPSFRRVSMRTAVCTVIWRQPAIRAPFSGFDAAYISRIFISPGISFSAISMALRPQSARLMSAAREEQVSELK